MPLSCRRRAAAALALSALLALVAPPAAAFDATLLHAATLRMGPDAMAALAPLQALIAHAARLDEAERLGVVNRFFNEQIAFATDPAVWGEEDHWATPLETLTRGRGDCEDYAIAKYAVLRAAGTPASRVRLVYAFAASDPSASAVLGPPTAHMVLAYQADGGLDEAMILDNLRAEVQPASQRPDLRPLFSFSEEGLWQGLGPRRVGDPLARLARWRDLLQRLRAEGWQTPPDRQDALSA